MLVVEKIMMYVVANKHLETYDEVWTLTQVMKKRERERRRKEWIEEKIREKRVRWRLLHNHLVRHE